MASCCAEAGQETQRWHQLAASLAGIPDSAASTALPLSLPPALPSSPTSALNTANVQADQVAAVMQHYSCKLGRIEDLVQELDNLRLQCPMLSSVTARQLSLTLVFLGLEAEVKFAVKIELGESSQTEPEDCMLGKHPLFVCTVSCRQQDSLLRVL